MTRYIGDVYVIIFRDCSHVLVAHNQSCLLDMENRSLEENGVRLIELHVSCFNGAINESCLYLIRTGDSIGITKKLRAQGEKIDISIRENNII